MLILTRRLNEVLIIEVLGLPKITVSPVEINKHREVRFFVGAPGAARIIRKYPRQKLGEKLDIEVGGNVITITPLNVNGRQIKVGIDAPRNIKIVREEIYNKPAKRKPE